MDWEGIFETILVFPAYMKPFPGGDGKNVL